MSTDRAVVLHDVLPPAFPLVFGCASLGSRYDRATSLRALAIAHDHGVNVFDTARSYGYGSSEAILGEFLKGRRDRVIVATKAGIRASAPPGRNGQVLRAVARKVFTFAPSLRAKAQRPLSRQHSHGHFEPSELRKSLEQSLRELGTDRVEVFFLHDVPSERARDEDVLDLLEVLRKEGKVVLAGPSTGADALTDIATSERALGSVIQFAASAARFPTWKAAFVELVASKRGSRLVRFGNRPFEGGAPLEPALERRLRALGSLNEVLLRLPLAAGVCDVVVTAMTNPDHIVANCQALLDAKIATLDLATLAASLFEKEKIEPCESTI
jgi:diketogulonate reductase-like aldo/keto reductase